MEWIDLRRVLCLPKFSILLYVVHFDFNVILYKVFLMKLRVHSV